MVISGSVAVKPGRGAIGKGGGYADLEYGLATAAGIVTPDIPVLTTIHPMQLLAEDLPRTDHDVPLDFARYAGRGYPVQWELPRPKGIYWEDLDERKISAIPLLGKLREGAERR